MNDFPVGVRLDGLKEFIMALESDEELNTFFEGDVLSNLALVSRGDLEIADTGSTRLSDTQKGRLTKMLVGFFREMVLKAKG